MSATDTAPTTTATDPAPVPVIMIVGSGAAGAVDELVRRYAPTYSIVQERSAEGALRRLHELAGLERVALALVERGAQARLVLDAVRRLHPHARRGLLLDWNESRTHREEVAAGFARRDAECFVTKPLTHPDERFHRSVTELLDEWWRACGPPAVAVTIVGDERSPRVHEMRDALQRHDIPFTFTTPDSPSGRATLDAAGTGTQRLPVVVLRNSNVLVDPTNVELASALGARTRPRAGVYDVVVVGGGPAGLSAAVYAQSEGLRTALVEPIAMGGQAGTSSMIRNYLGFPRGISGAELAARAFDQAVLFGTDMVYGARATGLRCDGALRIVELEDGSEVPARSVVVATGVSYRRLDLPSLQPFDGAGVFYGAGMSEARFLAGGDVFVVGGGNSAGQAAVHLARFARQVTMLIRGDSLADSMSSYLIDEIDSTHNIEVTYRVEVTGGGGDGRLESLELRDGSTGSARSVPASALFVLIGAQPYTDWLPSTVERDQWGYIHTAPTAESPTNLPYESTLRGVFAVGDVRRNSVKRVASAVGEGAVSIRFIHDYLATSDLARAAA